MVNADIKVGNIRFTVKSAVTATNKLEARIMMLLSYTIVEIYILYDRTVDMQI